MDKVEMRPGGGTDLAQFQKSSAEGLKKRCFLCGEQIVGGRRWRVTVHVEDTVNCTELACWPCYSKVSLYNEITVEREGLVLVVRVSPSARVERVGS